MMLSRSRMIAVCALFTAIGLILGYLESFIVIPVSVPGIRLGLANITTILAMYLLGPFYALTVLTLRVILSAVLFGTPVSFIYSFCGAVLSFAVMMILKRYDFSIISVSSAGGLLHNTGQIVAAYLLTQNVYIFYYLPYLAIAGVITGLVVGSLSGLLYTRLKGVIGKLQ